MKTKIMFLVTVFLFPTFLFAEGLDFPRPLYLGTRGEDVRTLQKILNSDTDTRVAVSGIGSAGNETNYFGPATKSALIKFQEKYKKEVLFPIGLSSGTGFFGERTRDKVMSILKTREIPASVVKGPTFVETGLQKKEVIVMFPSQYSGKPGTLITILGVGFTPKDNIIYFGTAHAVEKASSLSP